MTTDNFTVRAVVLFLGIAVLAGLGGIIWLIARGGTDAALLAIPAGITGTALGGLGTLLARTGRDQVEVINSPAAPVPVEAQP